MTLSYISFSSATPGVVTEVKNKMCLAEAALVGVVCQIVSLCAEYLNHLLLNIITCYRLLSIVVDFC